MEGEVMRISILATVFVAALSSAATAQADEPFASGLYVVGGYEAWWPTYAQIYDSGVPGMLNGFDADVGWRFNRYYAIEGGYYHASGSSDLNVTFQGAELDAFGFLPFGADSDVALYAEAGVTELWGTAGLNFGGYNVSVSANSFDPRAGAGFQYQIIDSLGIRAGAVYQWMNLQGLHSAKIGTLSLVWHVW